MIGRTISHYRVIEKLGQGGMGVVYKARDERLGRFVALKVLPPDKVADPARRQRFVQEAKAASALNHPNIITVYDIITVDGADCIVMEFVQGKTLDALIPRKGLRASEVLKYAIQIADALDTAHGAGIIHRDLKPANVMVSDAGRVKILDFGLAKLTETTRSDEDETQTAHTAEGTIVGTAAYMSPEQAEGRDVDARSDIFSFGAILYEMSTGQRAFLRESSLATLTAVLREDPKQPRLIVEDLPGELERIILRCLRKDPGRRFQDMLDLKVALEELKEESDTGRLISPKPGRPSRARLPWMGAGVLVLAAGALGVWYGVSHHQAAQAPMTQVPFTSSAGEVNTPSFSPDGRQVAFAWTGETQDNYDIYLKLVGPGDPLRLTKDPAAEYAPAWSRDGQYIAFLRRAEGNRHFIMVVPALGGPERKVGEGVFTPRICWSRDGQALFVSARETQDQPYGLFVMSLATGNLRRLTTGPAGAWLGDVGPTMSPDGRTLAFCRTMTRANSEIYTLPLSSTLEPAGEPRRVTFENRSSAAPAWTPDGTQIVFSTGTGTTGSLTSLMRIPFPSNGQQAERLPIGEGGEQPTLSSQGRLVYVRPVRDENIWSLYLSPGRAAPPARFIFSTRRDIEPHYSADGKKIAFCSDRSGTNEVWIANADGSNQMQLTSMGSPVTAAARWSPDGRHLAFVSNKEGQQEIYLIGAQGGAPVRLTDNPAHESAPSWSKDGKWLYFASNREKIFQVWKMAPDPKAAPVLVTRDGGFAAVESADGKTLYYAKRDSNDQWGVWKVATSGGEETRIIPYIPTWGDFDVTEQGIYYIDSARPGAKLRLHRFVDGKDIELTTLEKRSSFGVGASPDNRTVLFTRFDQESSELVLVENFR